MMHSNDHAQFALGSLATLKKFLADHLCNTRQDLRAEVYVRPFGQKAKIFKRVPGRKGKSTREISSIRLCTYRNLLSTTKDIVSIPDWEKEQHSGIWTYDFDRIKHQVQIIFTKDEFGTQILFRRVSSERLGETVQVPSPNAIAA